jgi:chemotaxis signal transduction protein
MVALTPLRARRFANRITEPTQQYVTFRLRQYWFALPVEALQRVSSADAGSRNESGIDIASAEPDDLTVINVGQRIFAEERAAVSSRSLGSLSAPETETTCFIVFQSSTGDRHRLPIDTQPKLLRIPQSKIGPFPSAHPIYGQLQSVCAVIAESDDAEPIFLLSPDQLCQNNDNAEAFQPLTVVS